MKILHILASDRFSGAENVVCQMIGMMRADPSYEFVYCSKDGPIREALAERNIAFVPLSDVTAREIRRVTREVSPDVIHAHDMRAGFAAARACGNIPLISHIHNNAFDARGVSPKSVAYILAAQKAKQIFWVSESAYRGYCFHSFFRKKSEVLVNVIDPDALYRKMQSDPQTYAYDVVYVGRLTYQKDPSRLVRVFAKLCERVPNATLAVVGTGEEEAQTKALCEELSLSERVHFLGYRSNPLKILSDAKVMLMTSRWEGTPMCALEAMALGVPIVSTPVDGLKDLIQNGENGYWEEDDDRLADRLAEIITQKDVAERMSRNAEKRFQEKNQSGAYRERLQRAYADAFTRGRS